MEEQKEELAIIEEDAKQELSPLDDYKQCFAIGVQQYEAGNFEEASKTFLDIYNKYPEQAEVLVNYGNCKYELAEIDEAVKYWEKAKAQDKYLVNTYVNLGNYYLANEKYLEAIDEFSFALCIEPQNDNIIANLAISYDKSNNKRKAYLFYDYFLNISTNLTSRNYKNINRRTAMNKINAIEQIKLGINYEKRGIYRKALQTYFNSLKLYPNFPKTYINIGNIFYRLEKYEYAKLYWMEAHKIDPKHLGLCINLGLCFEKLEDYISAYAFYIKFIKQTNHASQENIAAQTAAQKLYGTIMMSNEYIIKYKEKCEELYNTKQYDDALLYYENLRLINETQEIAEKIRELKMESNIVFKSAFISYEMAKRAFQNGDFDTAMHRAKLSLHMWPDCFFEKNATTLIEESQKAKNNSMLNLLRDQKHTNELQ